MDIKQALKAYFGYDSFRRGQEEIVSAILGGGDVLAIMPTGAGKSVCYQLPAMLMSGITVVISPLISLMQDQVMGLNDAGISAGYVNSSLSDAQIANVYSGALRGEYKLLYISPERLENRDFVDFANRAEISMVTVDEAHCISQWGQDFRPDYLKVADFVSSLPKRPVLAAFTATATKEVKDDISCMLRLRNPKVVITGFNRENLYFDVLMPASKHDYVLQYIKKHSGESGIIYCATRKQVDELCDFLLDSDVPATKYHGGMDNASRKKNQEDFIFDKAPIIVATNAFGMGIDKSNVRFVIHYNMPQSMENYYQEAGRAGRDGGYAECILLFSAQDIMINKFLLDHKDFVDIRPEDIELIRQRDVKRLQVMERYCKGTGCLRNYILEYFGEKCSSPCENCGNCQKEFTEIDMTEDAKQLINCVWEAKGRYGINIILGTLMGANRARLKELGTTGYKSYGALKNRSENELRMLLNQLVLDGYLYQTADKYSVIRIADIEPLKSQGARVIVRMHEDKKFKKQAKEKKKNTDKLTRSGYELFDILRGLRLNIAREEGLPPYIVFSDKTLIDMSAKAPCDKESMMEVSGVGEVKFERYGEKFINAIAAFNAANGPSVTSIE